MKVDKLKETIEEKIDEKFDEIKETIEEKNLKTNEFFKKFNPDGDEYFQISLYKIQDRNKRQWLNDYEKIIPTRNEIRDEYGAGTYWLYALDEKGNLLDSCQIHIGEPIKKDIPTHIPDRKEVINELKELLSVVQPQQQDNNKDLLKMIVEMNVKMNEKITELVLQMKESITKTQIESERKMFELIKEIQSKKTDIKDLLESMQILDELRGDKQNENNEILDVIKMFSPALMPMLQNNLKITQQKQENTTNEFQQFYNSITKENALTMAKMLYEKNKEKLTEEQANTIVQEILKQKGLI
jgi:hypothetical protein